MRQGSKAKAKKSTAKAKAKNSAKRSYNKRTPEPVEIKKVSIRDIDTSKLKDGEILKGVQLTYVSNKLRKFDIDTYLQLEVGQAMWHKGLTKNQIGGRVQTLNKAMKHIKTREGTHFRATYKYVGNEIVGGFISRDA